MGHKDIVKVRQSFDIVDIYYKMKDIVIDYRKG